MYKHCLLTFFILFSFSIFTFCQTTIASQGFEAGDSWSVTSGFGNISNSTGSGDTPANSRIRTGTMSWQVNDETATLELNSQNVSSYTSVQVTVRLSSTSLSSGNGADGADEIEVFINLDGNGFPATADVEVEGNNNARWDYSANLTATTTAGTPIVESAPQGGTNSNNYATIVINIPGGTNTVALRLTADNNASNEVWNVDDIELTGTLASSNDLDSDVSDTGAQPAAGSISSLNDTSGEAVDVFSMNISDQGTADGLETKVTNIRLKPHSSNTADWTDHIAGVVLDDGTNPITPSNVSITDTEIDISFPNTELLVADGGSETVNVAVYLNTSNIVDGAIFSCFVDADNHGFTADVSGSGFASTFPGGDFNSNDFTMEVAVTELRFVQQPSNANENASMSPAVTVEATDVNGNRDLDFTSGIDITSTGSLSGTPVTETATSGLATFSSLVHTVAGTNLTLNAERNGTGDLDVISSTFDILVIPVVGDIIITEIMYNPSGGEPGAEWFEVYNRSAKTIDMNGWEIRSGGTTRSITSSVNLTPGTYAVFGASSSGCGTEDFTYGTSLSLTNSNDDVSIIFSSTTIDEVSYSTSGSWPSSLNGYSIALNDETNQDESTNDDGSNWCHSTTSCSGDQGTPGSTNDACGAEIQLEQPVASDQPCNFTLNFGTVLVGESSSDLTIRISNDGNSNLTLTSLPLTLGGTDPSEFSIVSQPTSPVASFDSEDFEVRFSPTSGGAKTATISIANNDADENPCIVNLSGTGSPPLYFRTQTAGDWETTGTWESSEDNSNWSNATRIPGSMDLDINVRHATNITGTVDIDQLTIDAGITLEINSGATLNLLDGTGTDLTVSGTLRVSGSISGSGSISVENGGTYQHNPSSGGGTVPTATWNSGSTCEITDGSAKPSGLSQSFHHFTWNNTSQIGNLNLVGDLTTINGDLNVTSTGSGSIRFTGSGGGTLNVGGNLIIGAAGFFSFSNGGSDPTVNVTGNLEINGGTLDLACQSSGASLNLVGNFVFNSGTITESDSGTPTINFAGASNQDITSNGTISNNVNFGLNNSSGATLLTSFSIPNDFSFTSGLLKTNNQTISVSGSVSGEDDSKYFCTCDASGSTPATTGGLQLLLNSSSALTFPVGPNASFYMPVVLNSSGSHSADNFTVRVESLGSSGVTPADANQCIQFQWIIDEAVGGGSDASVSLQWETGTEGASFDPSDDPVIGRWNGSIFDPISPASFNAGGPALLSNNTFTAFSPFIAASSQSALPIELARFEGKLEEGNVYLIWETTMELDNHYFEVQKNNNGTDANEFVKIGKVMGAGFSNQVQSYNFIDNNPAKGVNHYRLKQTDFDGSFSFSPVVSILFDERKDDKINIYPNPAKNQLFITGLSEADKSVELEIFNATGQIVLKSKLALSDLNIIEINKLNPGQYILKIATENNVIIKNLLFD